MTALTRSVLILIAAAALQQCSPTPADQPQPALQGPRFQPIANVEQIMEALVIPSSDTIWNAAVWSNGVPEGQQIGRAHV